MGAGKLKRDGIDRIDSDEGYFINNCVTCCAKCNFAKRNLSVDVFLDLIKRIYEKHWL